MKLEKFIKIRKAKRRLGNMELDVQESEYLCSLYSQTNGYVKLMDSYSRKGFFHAASSMVSISDQNFCLNGTYLTPQNAMMSMCTFRKKGKATKDNINTVCCLAVDLDYTFLDKHDMLEKPLVVWDMLLSDIWEKGYIPMPTYLEYGHRLRLVYVMKSPVCLNIKNREKRNSTIIWLERITKVLCDKINAMDSRYGAEPHQLTKFVRIPESHNIRFVQDRNPYTGKVSFHVDSHHVVKIAEPRFGQKWEIHALSDAVLDALPDWYGEYKEKQSKKRKQKKISLRKNTTSFLSNRMDFLEKLRDTTDCRGRREIMTFLYWNFALQRGISKERARDMALAFNDKFCVPLIHKEALSHCFPRHTYKYRTSTMLELLGVTKKEARDLGLEVCSMETKKYDREYSRNYRARMRNERIKKGQTLTQRMEALKVEIFSLRKEGMTLISIARKVKKSLSTVKRMLSASRKENLVTA